MASSISIPSRIYSGDSLLVAITGATVLSGEFLSIDINIGNKINTFKGDASGVVRIPWTTTQNWPPGKYRWRAYLGDGSARTTIESDVIEVRSVLDDTETHEEKVLAAIKAILEGSDSIEFTQMSVEGRSLQRRSLGELLDLKADYESRVLKAKAMSKNGGVIPFGSIKIRTRSGL